MRRNNGSEDGSASRLRLGVALAIAFVVALGIPSSGMAQINVISVDNTPLVSPGTDFNGNLLNTMGLALQAVDQGLDFNVTEVTPAAFRIMSQVQLSAFDLIAILNDPRRIDDGNPAGLGATWNSVVGVNVGGRVVLSSHDPVRFHMNQLPGSGRFGAGFPGGPNEPFGAPSLVRQAALWAGGAAQTGLLIFNDAPSFAGGNGWNNAVLNLPAAWMITDLPQAGTGDGGYTDILAAFQTHPIYTGLSDARFAPTSISSFSANLGDLSFHTVFQSFNAGILAPTEVIINAGLVDVGGFGCCTFQTVPGPDGAAITLIREEVNTPPVASCVESVNPAGKTIPPAGSTTLPGPKGGKNEDGFYELIGEDAEDGTAPVFVTNASGSVTFGPFVSDSVVKITEAPGVMPSAKPMGGPDSAVSAHITLDSDAFVFAVDSFGEFSPVVDCLVPPPPK